AERLGEVPRQLGRRLVEIRYGHRSRRRPRGRLPDLGVAERPLELDLAARAGDAELDDEVALPPPRLASRADPGLAEPVEAPRHRIRHRLAIDDELLVAGYEWQDDDARPLRCPRCPNHQRNEDDGPTERTHREQHIKKTRITGRRTGRARAG